MGVSSFLAGAGVAISIAAVAIGYWQWRRSGSQVAMQLSLVRPDGLPYFPTTKDQHVPRWKITARNLGRTGSSVVSIWLLNGDGAMFAKDAEGPHLPADLQPGHSAEWIFPETMTLEGFAQGRVEFGTGKVLLEMLEVHGPDNRWFISKL